MSLKELILSFPFMSLPLLFSVSSFILFLSSLVTANLLTSIVYQRHHKISFDSERMMVGNKKGTEIVPYATGRMDFVAWGGRTYSLRWEPEREWERINKKEREREWEREREKCSMRESDLWSFQTRVMSFSSFPFSCLFFLPFLPLLILLSFLFPLLRILLLPLFL